MKFTSLENLYVCGIFPNEQSLVLFVTAILEVLYFKLDHMINAQVLHFCTILFTLSYVPCIHLYIPYSRKFLKG